MYPATEEQSVRWVKAYNLENERIPAHGCCEAVYIGREFATNGKQDGGYMIYVRKPRTPAVLWGDSASFCFAGPSGIGPNRTSLEGEPEATGVVTFDKPCIATLERSSVKSSEVSDFRTEWITRSTNGGRSNGDSLTSRSNANVYVGPTPNSYKLSFGTNNWWRALNVGSPPQNISHPWMCMLFHGTRKTIVPRPVYTYGGNVYTAEAGKSFGIAGLSSSLIEYWPASYAGDYGAALTERFRGVTRLITPYWYGKWQISIAATLWSATADRGERLAIGVTTRRRGWSSDAVQSQPYAAREQDITISAYGDITHLSKENVAVTHTQFLYPFTEIDVINASDVQASISDVTISITALDTTASEDDLSDYDSYETTLRNLGL